MYDFGDEAAPAWVIFAQLWPQFTTFQLPVKKHTAADEAQVLQWWADKVPGISVDQAIAGLTSGTPDPEVLLHGDLHDKHLFFDGSRLSLVSLETLARGEAAADLGNVLAYAELRWYQGNINDATRDVMVDSVHTLADSLHVSPARRRVACVYSFRPQASSWLAQWVATFS